MTAAILPPVLHKSVLLFTIIFFIHAMDFATHFLLQKKTNSEESHKIFIPERILMQTMNILSLHKENPPFEIPLKKAKLTLYAFGKCWSCKI